MTDEPREVYEDEDGVLQIRIFEDRAERWNRQQDQWQFVAAYRAIEAE